MDIHHAIDFATSYLKIRFADRENPSDTQYVLKRDAQYALCDSFNCILSIEGKITRRQVILIVENWILNHSDVNPIQPAPST